MDFSGIVRVYRGALVPGRIKLQPDFVAFKASGNDDILRVEKSTVTSAQWSRAARGYMLKLLTASHVYKFCGFQESDRTKLSDYVSKSLKVELEDVELCVRGMNWGEVEFQGPLLRFMADKKPAFELTLNDVSNVTTGKNEVTLQFHQNDSAPVSLMEMRLHIPASTEGDEDNLQAFKDKVLANADIMEATGDAIASFGEVHCLTPRGRYTIKAYPTFLEMHGKTFDYKIPYNTVLQLILLPHNDQRNMFFVLGLDPPIRQGQTMYPFIILSFPSDDEVDITLTLTEEELAGYDGKLTKEMTGPIYEVFSRLTRALVGKKIAVPGKFKSHSGTSAVSCGHKSSTGFLYPLDKGMIFVHKPTVYVKYEQVACVNFARVSSGGSGASRSFDFEIDLKNGNGYTFSSIMKDDYGRLFDFITSKNIKVKNKGVKPVSYDDGGSDSESGHDVYLERVKAEGQERDSEDEDSDFVAQDSGSDNDALEYDESAEDSDEDKPAAEPSSSHKKHKSSSKSSATGSKRSRPSSDGKSTKSKKAKKDPNAPKKPLSAYMLWLQESRPSLKKKYPGASVTELAKRAGEVWKGISDKSKWEADARRAKTKYLEQMKEYQRTGKPVDKKSPAKKSSSSSSSKKPAPSSSSEKKYKSEEFVVDSSDAEEEDDKEEKANASKRSRRRGDDSELVALSEGSHDESEAQISGSDGDDDDDDDD